MLLNLNNTLGPFLFFLALLVNNIPMSGQAIYPSPGEDTDPNRIYLFYLHGAIVQQLGEKAVSVKYGAYEYANIVSRFADLGYQVISEVRPKDSKIKEYSSKITAEIKELISKGVPSKQIVVVGASMGGYITIEAAYKLNNGDIKYAVLGVCSDHAQKYFADKKQGLAGNFFSIYETSDQAGSCGSILNKAKFSNNFQELALNMGNGHGFLYKPYAEWINPLSSWIDGR